MAQEDFQVVFEGELVAGADPAAVRANLAKLFKTDVARVEPLFAGGRKVVKRGLDEETARKYCIAFERAGAVAEVVGPPAAPPPTAAAEAATSAAPGPGPHAEQPPERGPEPAPSPEPVVAAPSTAEPTSPAPTAAAADESDEPTRTEIAQASRAPPPAAARGTPSVPADMTMADAGADLVIDAVPPPPPDIDTDHLSLAEPGVDLTQPKTVPEPQFNTDFDLAPPGENLGETLGDST